MNGHLFTLVFLLVGAVPTHSQPYYYITPSPENSCIKDPCLTLSEFAGTGQETNVVLIFMPGNHSLDRELTLSHADNFSMESQKDEQVLIECTSESARFVVDKTPVFHWLWK